MKLFHQKPIQEDPLPERYQVIPPAPARDPEKEAAGRARFLAEAHRLKDATGIDRPVSPALLPRLNQWITSIKTQLIPKERSPMFATLVSILVSLVLVVGGGAATAYAAQDSLPNDFLYPVKTWQEDAMLTLTSNPQAQIERLMAYSDTRLQEIVALNALGKPIPAVVAERLRLHNEQAIAIASSELEEEPLDEVLTKLRIHLRRQDQIMSMVQANAPDHIDPVLEQVRMRIEEHVRMVELGLEDPLQLKQEVQFRLNRPEEAPFGPSEDPGQGAGPGPQEPQGDPADSPGPGPEAGPGPSYGPGNENDSGNPDAPGNGPGSSGSNQQGTPGGSTSPAPAGGNGKRP